MPAVGTPSFEQLSLFAAVAEAGSFSAAARRLGRAQSVVSYGIAQLEAQLGLVLFDRSGRLPALTEAGRAILADARRAGRAVDSLKARAAGLQAGLEAEVALGVDVMVPTGALVGVLEDFAAAFDSAHPSGGIWGGLDGVIGQAAAGVGCGASLGDASRSVSSSPLGGRLLSASRLR